MVPPSSHVHLTIAGPLLPQPNQRFSVQSSGHSCWAAAGGRRAHPARARRADCAAAQTEQLAVPSLLSPDPGSLAERDAPGRAGARAAWAPSSEATSVLKCGALQTEVLVFAWELFWAVRTKAMPLSPQIVPARRWAFRVPMGCGGPAPPPWSDSRGPAFVLRDGGAVPSMRSCSCACVQVTDTRPGRPPWRQQPVGRPLP